MLFLNFLGIDYIVSIVTFSITTSQYNNILGNNICQYLLAFDCYAFKVNRWMCEYIDVIMFGLYLFIGINSVSIEFSHQISTKIIIYLYIHTFTFVFPLKMFVCNYNLKHKQPTDWINKSGTMHNLCMFFFLYFANSPNCNWMQE